MSAALRIGVTGAGGFVGSALLGRLAAAGHVLVPLVRRQSDDPYAVEVGDLADMDADAIVARTGPLDALVHLAALTASDRSDDDAAFRRANVDATRRVLALAQAAGARHIVFISTVKVHGNTSPPGHSFDETDMLAPADAYGRSKLAAEELVRAQAPSAGLAWTIIRPPLVYGPGAAANFARLARLAATGLPIPLGGIANRRSIVFIDNLCDFIATVLISSAARGETFLVADAEDLSTTELLRALAVAAGARAWLVPIPSRIVAALARATGRAGLADRLFGDLAVSCARARRLLGWTPPVSSAEGLRRTMAAR